MLKAASLVSLIAALLAVGLALVSGALGWGIPIRFFVGGFLVAFGLGKGLIAVAKLRALALVPAGGPDPRSEFANRSLFWLFIAFKFLTWLVAWAVAAYLFAHEAAFTGR